MRSIERIRGIDVMPARVVSRNQDVHVFVYN